MDMDIAWVSTARDRDVRDGLLAQAGLAVDGDVTRSVLLYDGDMAVGTASRKDNVLKWFAINPSYQGQGLVGMLLTPLATEAIAAGIHVVDIQELRHKAERIVGHPLPIQYTDQIVGIVTYRDGSVIDLVRGVKEMDED